MTYILNLSVFGEIYSQKIYTLQLLHTVIVQDNVKRAITKIKRVNIMPLKTGKNGYRKSGVRKDKKRHM